LLDDVGFIHCSAAEQVTEVTDAFYSDDPLTLTVLEVDVDAIEANGTAVRWELAGEELLPCPQGALCPEFVVSVTPLARGCDRRQLGERSFVRMGPRRPRAAPRFFGWVPLMALNRYSLAIVPCDMNRWEIVERRSTANFTKACPTGSRSRKNPRHYRLSRHLPCVRDADHFGLCRRQPVRACWG